MSKSKKNSIMYIKPQEPNFITRMKAEAGYIEGDTVNTKRESLPFADDDDFEDRDEEQPVVVVLKPGDISAEEADRIAAQIKEEAEKAPANLEERVIFRARPKADQPEAKPAGDSKSKRTLPEEKSSKKSRKKSKPAPSLLSFDDDELDDDC